MLWHEVAYSDRPDTAVGEKRLERAVGVDREIKLAGQRLMKDEQVELLDVELARALVASVEGLVVTVIADPHLRLDEDVRAVDARAANRRTDLALIEVSSGGIDEAVTGRQGALDGGLRLFIGDLEDTKAEAWHYDAIVQGDRGVHGFDDKHEEKFVPTSTDNAG